MRTTLKGNAMTATTRTTSTAAARSGWQRWVRQLDRLAARRAPLGAEGARPADRDWRDLALPLRAQLQAGAAPSSERVQQLARRAHDSMPRSRVVTRPCGARRPPPRPRAADGVARWDTGLLDYLCQTR